MSQDEVGAKPMARTDAESNLRLRKKRERRANSLCSQIETALLVGTRGVGHALTQPEWMQAYVEQFGEVPQKTFGGTAGALLKDGRVLAIGGRHGRTQYVHPTHVVPLKPVDDFALDVYAVLRAECEAKQRPLSTREVTSAVRAAGIPIKNHSVIGGVLVMMSKNTFSPALGERHAPLVSCALRRRLGGRAARFWAPIGTPYTEPDTRTGLDTQVGAMRRCVELVEAELGRPVSRRELLWWHGAHATANMVATAMNTDKLAETLAQSVIADEPHVGAAGRIAAVRTEFTAHGASPLRYHIGEMPGDYPTRLSACALEDGCELYRLAAEIADLGQFDFDLGPRSPNAVGEAPTGRSQSTRLSGAVNPYYEYAERSTRAIVDLRRDVLTAAIHRIAGEDWQAALGIYEHAMSARNRWVQMAMNAAGAEEQPAKMRAYTKLREQEIHARHCSALRGMLARTVTAEQLAQFRALLRSVRIVGEQTSVSINSLHPLLAAAARAIGVPSDKEANVLRGVRRTGHGISADKRLFRKSALGTPFGAAAKVDRVDMVLACFEAVGGRPAWLLAKPARLLGHVLRDPHVIREWYDKSASADSDRRQERRDLLLAYALLGQTIEDPLDLMGSEYSEADAQAACLSVVVAKPRAALAQLQWLRRSAIAWEDVIDGAIRRVENGLLCSVII